MQEEPLATVSELCSPPVGASTRSEESGPDSRIYSNFTSTADNSTECDCSSRGMHTSGKPSDITWDDATWILTSSFIIFTMQSGFGLLESGMVRTKNEVNILVKNTVDVIFGGLSFWLFGFGILFENYTEGEPLNKNAFSGTGPFLVDAESKDMGYIFSCFIFQLSFSTTATTIVSGAMAERTKLSAYIIFSFLNTIVYSFPAYWIWAPSGFLRRLGAVDIAGAGPVHVVGGFTGLVATLMLKPRTGRFEGQNPRPPDMGCPTNAILGMFMLWWGWLGFNTGSTFGISGGKWKLAARSAVATVLASMGGGTTGLAFSFLLKKRKFDVCDLINGVLGSLVSITAICALAHPWEALVIGSIGGLVAIGTVPLLARLKVDDPVGAISVHGFSAVWALVSVGLFVEEDRLECLTQGRRGLFRGGGFYLLGVQLLSCLVMIAWTSVLSVILLKSIDLIVGLRLSLEEELLGADIVEHGISHGEIELEHDGQVPTSNEIFITNYSNTITKEYSSCSQLRETILVNGVPQAFQENGHSNLVNRHANLPTIELGLPTDELGLPKLERARSLTCNGFLSPQSIMTCSARGGRRPRSGCTTPRAHLSMSSIDWRSDVINSYGSVGDNSIQSVKI